MRTALIVIFLTLPASAVSDILYLRDGSCHYGRLVQRAEGAVVFQVVLPDGRSYAVRTFSASAVERVDETGEIDLEPDASEEAGGVDGLPAPVGQMLREAFELLDDADESAAMRALQRAVLAASPSGLAELERQCQEARGVTLARLMADTRVHVALAADDGQTLRIPYATPYERDALAARLLELERDHGQRRYSGRTLAEWVVHRREYTEVSAEARALARDAGVAAAVIGARLRYDPQLKTDGDERVRLIHLRAELGRLAARVRSLRGFTAPDAEARLAEPARQAAEALVREQAQAADELAAPATSNADAVDTKEYPTK